MAETAVFHLLANFAPFLQQEAHLLTGVRNEVEYIRDEFNRMMSFLRVADAIEENDPKLKVWVKQVREAAYDIGDVLDLFMLRLGHRHGHGFCGFLRRVSYFIKTSIARHQIASEVQRMKSKVDNIWKGHQRYHDRYGMLEQGSSSRSTGFNKAWHDCRGDALLLDEAELVGIDEPKSHIITWKTFMENSCTSYLEGLSRAILKRCEGLPLAIVAISGLLSTKDNNVDEWDKINRSLGAELGGNDELLSPKGENLDGSQHPMGSIEGLVLEYEYLKSKGRFDFNEKSKTFSDFNEALF
ncbi:Disease resistance protein PIK6-NP [Camellia lanceoleosa]|uniref:Disease resistance protein PIK6-NP n=1 Tax=Camellia lanceoleosa TaxID=1840588 RepID=A0ACC0HA19_9ERIC|nr:Disease resistance protein PIK6-NP [Camellia lanceoleosa]